MLKFMKLFNAHLSYFQIKIPCSETKSKWLFKIKLDVYNQWQNTWQKVRKSSTISVFAYVLTTITKNYFLEGWLDTSQWLHPILRLSFLFKEKKYIILDIEYHFTSGDRTLHVKALNCKDMSLIVWKFFICIFCR